MEKLNVAKDPSEIHEKSSLYNNTLFKTFTTWSAISKDGRCVLLTACDMSSVHCLMQILTAFFFLYFLVSPCVHFMLQAKCHQMTSLL